MRLLFDQNLSQRLTKGLADIFPDALHVADLELERASDAALWRYARAADLIIVTKDVDFEDGAAFPGPPPKVIRVTLGNAPPVRASASHHR